MLNIKLVNKINPLFSQYLSQKFSVKEQSSQIAWMSTQLLCKESFLLASKAFSNNVNSIFRCSETEMNFLLGNLIAFDLSSFHFVAFVFTAMRCLMVSGKDRRWEKWSFVETKWSFRDSTVEYCKTLGEGCWSKDSEQSSFPQPS